MPTWDVSYTVVRPGTTTLQAGAVGGASVELVGNAPVAGPRVVTSTGSGSINFRGVTAGPFILRIRANGFVPLDYPVDVPGRIQPWIQLAPQE